MNLARVPATLLLAFSISCASTGATSEAPAPPEGPRESALGVIDGFKAQNWEKVSEGLSVERKSSLDDTWFNMWVGELAQAKDLQVTDAAVDPDGIRARVRVAFKLDGKAHETTVRMVREEGAWKWDER